MDRAKKEGLPAPLALCRMDPVRIFDPFLTGRVIAHGRVNVAVSCDDRHLLDGHSPVQEARHQRPAETVRVDIFHTGSSCQPFQHGANSAGQKALPTLSDEQRFFVICPG